MSRAPSTSSCGATGSQGPRARKSALKPGRIPRHVSVIPDGNRRWARARGLPPGDGYAQGIVPGLTMLERCRDLGIEEVSVYGFTKENVQRRGEQVEAFRAACTALAQRAAEAGTGVRVIGDTTSPMFPPELRGFVRRRSHGYPRLNLLVNYSWQWDVEHALAHAAANGGVRRSEIVTTLGSGSVPRVDLVVRWGGRRRLSGFLPMQCAYADFYVVDTLWPDSRPEELLEALAWYQAQDITMGG